MSMTALHPCSPLRRSLWRVLLGVLLMAAMTALQAQAPAVTPAEPPPALDLHEQVIRVSVTVRNLYQREQTREIPVTVFRPAGAGPWPLVVMNHGRATADKRASQGRARYEHLSRYFVHHGYVVMLPTRVGYGETYGDFDPEDAGSCSSPRLEPMSLAASTQVLAVVEHARSLPYVDASRWLVMGQSLGGLTAIATVGRQPAGLIAGVNFAGGRGGDPKARPGDPCTPDATGRSWKRTAASARTPMLWLYWRNDQYWGEKYPLEWHRAWVEGGGLAEFHQLPPSGEDGHNGVSADMDRWVPLFEAFARGLGLDFGQWPKRAQADASVRVDDMAQVPLSAASRSAGYEKFLQARSPRAFAISPSGVWGWATGDWAMGRALGNCQARRGETCKLYAIDDQVVWSR